MTVRIAVLVTLAACQATDEAPAAVAPVVAEAPPPPEVPPPPRWPAADAPLGAPVAVFPADSHVAIYVDGGHGAPKNHGMQAVSCRDEEELTLGYADALVERLGRDPSLAVAESRRDGNIAYDDRIRAAERMHADLMLSLHVDSRAGVVPPVLEENGCWSQAGEEGFAVLWSDEGDAGLVATRKRYAEAFAARLAEAGFTPYAGYAFTEVYAADPEHPGVYLDRHADRQRIRVLRRPKVPSIIVETHHGRDLEEHARWDEPRTWDAFAAAIDAGLADVATPVP
jgi:N-acetylmuramoyl-L-alanine amidase